MNTFNNLSESPRMLTFTFKVPHEQVAELPERAPRPQTGKKSDILTQSQNVILTMLLHDLRQARFRLSNAYKKERLGDETCLHAIFRWCTIQENVCVPYNRDLYEAEKLFDTICGRGRYTLTIYRPEFQGSYNFYCH